jgi:4-amino-4-deoxy-L-arabinose transferase-like glycosyltransferase
MSTSDQTFLREAGERRSPTALPATVGQARLRLAAVAGTAKAQLVVLMALAGGLNLWALSRNGWANTYYSAAVRSMSSSWHDFLFGAMDRTGAMTVDKPPLALWVQALSARVFGYHPLSVLVPQAVMGMASVALVYDLVRRRFGKLGGFVAGLAFAITPIEVAVSRHNNPDALLVLCCVAALWCTVRALEGRSFRWLLLAGVWVGLGFETKMAVALMVVPGIAGAWLWVAPNGRKRALGELLGAGGAMALVGGAWPALIELTPASDRPWVSGTSGNTIWELISEYNGVGRLNGQTGGPAGASGVGGLGGNMFGGTLGPGRLLNAALGGQAGWLLGFALVSGVAVALACRLRRSDERTGWLIAVGGAFVVTAVVFSEAKGIFHPYYVSLLAPFAAALTGAGVGQLRRSSTNARIMAPLAIGVGVAAELVVIGRYPGQLEWLVPVVIVVGAMGAFALAAVKDRTIRTAALGGAVAALLIAPGIWAVDTLGYATNGTFPEGGPQSALTAGGLRPGGGSGPGGGGPGGGSGPVGGFGGVRGPGGVGGSPAGPSVGSPAGPPAGARGVPLFGSGTGDAAGGGGAIGAPLGNSRTIGRTIAYAKAHGGGTVAVASQSSAASAIVSEGAEVAGIGGFSGRESDVSVAWLADEVSKGKIVWVLSEGASAGGARLPGDTRTGSKKAMVAVERVCEKVTLPSSGAGEAEGRGAGEAAGTGETGGEGGLYDCRGRAAMLAGV